MTKNLGVTTIHYTQRPSETEKSSHSKRIDHVEHKENKTVKERKIEVIVNSQLVEVNLNKIKYYWRRLLHFSRG